MWTEAGGSGDLVWQDSFETTLGVYSFNIYGTFLEDCSTNIQHYSSILFLLTTFSPPLRPPALYPTRKILRPLLNRPPLTFISFIPAKALFLFVPSIFPFFVFIVLWYMHTLHTSMHAYIRTYVHTCMHAYIHAHTHTYVNIDVATSPLVCRLRGWFVRGVRWVRALPSGIIHGCCGG